MAQFDVHINPRRETAQEVPYLLDIQHRLLDELATRVVVPLRSMASMPRPARTLNPVFQVDGQRVVMSTAELAGVPASQLGEVVGSLEVERDAIIRAVDLVITGV